VAPFATDIEAIRAVPAILAAGIVPCAVEFVEHSAIRCAERTLGKEWPAHTGGASLMIILDGRNEDAVLAEAESISDILERGGAREVLVADGREKQAEILAIRSAMYEALRPDRGAVRHLRAALRDRRPRRPSPAGSGLHTASTFGRAADGNDSPLPAPLSLGDGVIGAEVPRLARTSREVRTSSSRTLFARGRSDLGRTWHRDREAGVPVTHGNPVAWT
jgi:FAD/FMN-containing dehydrogenase